MGYTFKLRTVGNQGLLGEELAPSRDELTYWFFIYIQQQKWIQQIVFIYVYTCTHIWTYNTDNQRKMGYQIEC